MHDQNQLGAASVTAGQPQQMHAEVHKQSVCPTGWPRHQHVVLCVHLLPVGVQLPSALQLPLKQQQPAADAGTAADAGAVPASPSSEVDVDSLAASVPSRLLVSLLAAAAGPEVAGPAADVLASLDLTAAAKNDFLALFKSQQRFPEVGTALTTVLCTDKPAFGMGCNLQQPHAAHVLGRLQLVCAACNPAAALRRRSSSNVGAGMLSTALRPRKYRSCMLLQVFACSAAVSGAEAHLQELLPKLAASAGVRSLSYVSIQNQGNYLVELPAARTDVPKGWDKVRGVELACSATAFCMPLS